MEFKQLVQPKVEEGGETTKRVRKSALYSCKKENTKCIPDDTSKYSCEYLINLYLGVTWLSNDEASPKGFPSPDSANGEFLFHYNLVSLNLNLEVSGEFSKYALFHTEEAYERPGKIWNNKIASLAKDGSVKLKDNLQEIYDYVKVNEEAWSYLKAWFGCDYEIWM